jgi:carboxyl-terminal processing protease
LTCCLTPSTLRRAARDIVAGDEEQWENIGPALGGTRLRPASIVSRIIQVEVSKRVSRVTVLAALVFCTSFSHSGTRAAAAAPLGATAADTDQAQNPTPQAPPPKPAAQPGDHASSQAASPTSNQKSEVASHAANAAVDDPVARGAAEIARVYGAVEANYLTPVDPDQTLLDGAVRKALAMLDPFSSFFDRDQFRQLQEQARGQALGFGSILYVSPGKVLVIETAQGSPSWRAGMGPGDEIVEVNGTRLAGLDIQSLIEVLQKARSGPVRLGVIHPGRFVSQEVRLNPAEVALPTADKVFLLKPGIGYIHLTGFESKTPQELSDALAKLSEASSATPAGTSAAGGARARGSKAGSLQGLILDLRDNHGGEVDAALGVASILLPPGLSVLTIRGRVQAPQTMRTVAMPPAYHTYRGPLVVLVNGETASAAEVVAAALAEHDRAVIAGEPTFGKGVVQSVMPLSDSMALALTTAQYFTPSGRSIQRPIPGTSLAAMDPSRTGQTSGFRTDDGRGLAASGGVTPDAIIPTRPTDPWLAFLDQRGAFTDFASEYRSAHGEIQRSFQPDAQTLSDFRGYLQRSGVLAPDEYWDHDQDYLKLRIRTELMNLVYGLSLGDQVATEGDPQVQGAADLFSRIQELLKPASLPSS